MKALPHLALLFALLAPMAQAAEPAGVLRWDLPRLAVALGLSEAQTRDYFTDGRRISFLLERRIAEQVLKGRLAPSEGSPYDVIDAQGGRWEVRSLSDRGLYFCPSHMVGSSRHFKLAGFYQKLAGLKGYVVSDIERFPAVPYWLIPVAQVRQWWDAGQLGTTTKVSHTEALQLLAAMP